MEDETTVDAIHRLLSELAETKNQIKTTRDQIEGILEHNDEYKQLQEEVKTLITKRTEMKKMLDADKDYKHFNEELDELRFKLKDLQEILSHHLVTYYNETRSTQIKDQDGEVRPVLLSAKIGRPEAIPGE